ncbi:MAG: FAD-dependent monooxygenase [Rhizobiales bacterium]|nr:FAD-dependent monooxygenase [Hyphomicrobiales bacterium]
MTTANPRTAPVTQTAPVAIVGGGPVGLLLALFLDRYGVRSVLFNTDAEVRPHPKGSTHNARTMEHHRRLGFASAIRALGLPPERPTDVRYFTRLNGWELARIPMLSEGEKLHAVATSAATDQVPEPLLRANQLYVEQFLLERAREARNITVRFGWHVDRFEDDDDGATIHAESMENGARESWRTQYLVGCDGGRSSVRRSLALRYHGLGKLDVPHFGGRMVATHMRAPTLYRDHLARHHGWQYWMINPDMRATIITLAGDEEFLVFSKATDDNVPPPDAEISAKLEQGVGAAFKHKMLDHRLWTAGVALVAERFVAGRVILAGDAAHLFTPTGGFGMNTGMDDAANLAWKLAAAVQGWGGTGLIQTYETERRPVAERNTNAARELNKNLTNYTVAPAIEQDTAEGAAERRRQRTPARPARPLHSLRCPRRPRAALLARRRPWRRQLPLRQIRPWLHAAAARRQGSGCRGHRSRREAARAAAQDHRPASCRGPRALRPRPRADPAGSVCGLARQCAAGRP